MEPLFFLKEVSMLVSTREDFEIALAVLKNIDGPLVIDTETTGLEMFAREAPARMVGIAVGSALAPGSDYYFAFRHEEGENLPIELLDPLRELFKGREWCCHNAAFDVKILHCDGFELPPKLTDTIVYSHLANENEVSFALKALGVKYLGVDADKEDEALRLELKARKLGKGGICKLPAVTVAPYALADIDLTRRLRENRLSELVTWGLVDLAGEVNDFLLALIRMEIRGLVLDQGEVHRQLGSLGPKIVQYRNELFALAGREININSPKQLSDWLKVPSTAKPELEEILARDQRQDIRTLLDYRALFKAESTYFRPFLERVGTDGRVRMSYKIHGTVTGRLSGDGQQLCRDQAGRAYSVRSCFVAPPGSFLLEADYSTIEPRIAAHYSKDPTMQAAFIEGKDFHTAVARSMYHKDNINKDERTSAKTLGLGVLYGMGAFKSAVKLGLRHQKLPGGGYEFHYENVWAMSPEGELQQYPCSAVNPEFCTHAGRGYIRKFYAGLPELEPCIKAVRSTAARNGYIRNPITGRCSRFEGHRHPHLAFNSLIQQTAAEILRRALTRLDKHFQGCEGAPKMVLTVHDSIVFEVKYGPNAEAWVHLIKEFMETTTKLTVPVLVDFKVGLSLGNMGEIRV